MYRKHFGLTRHLIGNDIPHDELFVANSTREAEIRIEHLIKLRGMGLLTGEAGSGKTTAGRKVVGALHEGLYRVFYVPLSTGNVMDTYKSIGWEMGLPVSRNRAAAYRTIRAEVTRLCHEAKKSPILIIDDAHHLRNDVLEDLRLLTCYGMDSDNRLCLLLIGLTEIRRRLRMAVHESLEQRLIVKHHLGGLQRDELGAYLIYHLRRCGTELPLFCPEAEEALFAASNGLLRKVNRYAHYALLAAAVDKKKGVEAPHVEQALKEVGP